MFASPTVLANKMMREEGERLPAKARGIDLEVLVMFQNFATS